MEGESFIQTPSLSDEDAGITRQSADYPPSVWGDYFIKHPSPPFSSAAQKSEEWIRERVAELVTQVKNLIEDCGGDDLKSMELIDSLQRLGVGYRFEEEIAGALKRIRDAGRIDGSDLHSAALRFRLLRQQGYYVKSDVFNKFKVDGEFDSRLADDVRGLLSLYEACFMATHEDDVMDGALGFARRHLSETERRPDSAMKALVSHALELPLQRRIPRLEARYYMEAYEEDKEHKSEVMAELAKLDFHLLQLLHYQEVRSLSIWWEGIGENFDFTRNRIVECYFWILSAYFEPEYSKARMIAAKMTALLSITDDVYDVYGTLDELRSFTDIIQRWDVEEADLQLKGVMRAQFQNITKTFQEFEDELSSSGKTYRVHYLKEIFKVVASAWLKEAEWREEGRVPVLKEHLQLTAITTCYNLLSCATFLGMDDSATHELFDWVLTFPKYTNHASIICRLKDDVTSHELEQKRNHVASTVQCYMKEHNSTLEEACEQLLAMVDDEWKSLNHEYLSLSATFPQAVLMRVINLARFMETTYDVQDKYTHSSLIKGHISKILVEPISF